MNCIANRRGLGLLSADVGRYLRNNRADVKTVQHLINNAYDHRLLSLTTRLAPDGRLGARTEAAIVTAERAFTGLATPHGIIRKDDDTIRALTRAVRPGFTSLHLALVMLNATDGQVTRFAQPIARIFAQFQINTPLRQAHFLAQIGHESGELRYQEELASGAAYEGRGDLGNCEPGDGQRFKGRGLIQLTGRANYRSFARALGREAEIIANPSLVATECDLCTGVAAWYWQSRDLNRFADDDNLRAITRRINGGYNGLAHRRALLERSKALFGLL